MRHHTTMHRPAIFPMRSLGLLSAAHAVNHAQAVLGGENGDYAKAVAPATLSTKVFNAGPSLIEALLAGEIDVGYVGPGPALNAHVRSRGASIRVIAGAAANGVLIVARPDTGIQSLSDLKGKRIATPQLGNTQDISAKHYLLDVLKQEDVSNVLAVANAEQAALMARGQIDAAWVPEPWGSRLIIENGAKLLAEEKDLWPGKDFPLTLVVTTPEFLAAHREIVARLLAAHVRLTRELNRAPKQYVASLEEALAKLTGKRLPAGVIESSLKHVRFTDDPLESTLATMGQWAYELKMTPRPPDLRGLVDTTVLAEVNRGER